MENLIVPMSSMLSQARGHLKAITMLEAEDYDVFCEASAYSPFEYKWRQNRNESERDELIEKLHDINELAMNQYGQVIPDAARELLDNNTSSPTYGKCRVCGRDIVDGQHEIDHSPLLNAMLK